MYGARESKAPSHSLKMSRSGLIYEAMGVISQSKNIIKLYRSKVNERGTTIKCAITTQSRHPEGMCWIEQMLYVLILLNNE